MNKFNLGDTVLSIRFGFGIIISISEDDIENCLKINFNGSNITYHKDGRAYDVDFAPSLLTLEEAAKLGYFPVGNSSDPIGIIKTIKHTSNDWTVE